MGSGVPKLNRGLPHSLTEQIRIQTNVSVAQKVIRRLLTVNQFVNDGSYRLVSLCRVSSFY